ncbi:MAG: ArnT family glycosyltransferase [Isosphaeraceae bacterium]
MSLPTPRPDFGARREILIIAAMTVVGGMLRLWALGRLGLVHFDEGIYAMAGGWIHSPRGIAGLDPTVIAYAPPGFPFLVGLAYGVLGDVDIAAILVSIVAGVLTIPIVGWLGWRTYGRGAGAAAAALCALAGPHIAFSRMALTDASFLLAWLVAIGLGQRFLERPGPSRALAFGLAVGMAQLFKYNGWIAGATVAACAGLLTLARPRDRAAWLGLWGWGLVAAAVAALVYWPWFQFVQGHGGYAGLLAHQRGYMGGLASWTGYAVTQLRQNHALSGGPGLLLASGLAAALAMMATRGLRGGAVAAISLAMIVSAVVLAFGVLFAAFLAVWLMAVGLDRPIGRSAGLLVVAWAGLAILTPFYHPYARLMLPVQSMSWLLAAGLFVRLGQGIERMTATATPAAIGGREKLLFAGAALWLLPTMLALTAYWESSRGLAELLTPSDSVRAACRKITSILPKNVESLRLLARPPVTFYLSSKVAVSPQPTLGQLLEGRDTGSWALIDGAMIKPSGEYRRQLAGARVRWDFVREVPTTMNLPTLLDVDPGAAASGGRSPSASLLLFRPKGSGAPR